MNKMEEMNRIKMEEMIDKLTHARKNWYKAYPNSRETPWDAIYLKVETRQDNSHYFGFNPSHQSHLNSCGGFTIEDFQNWLDGKVVPNGIIKSQEAWDELLWICKTGGIATLIGYEIEHFNGYTPTYLLAPGQRFIKDEVVTIGKGLPKKMQKTQQNRYGYTEKVMTPELVKAVEQHIKWIYKRDMEDQLVFGQDVYSVQIRREAQEEAYGFTFALKCMGLETRSDGASNTPKVRENFAWWRNLLQLEAKWDLWIEKGIAYEPWIRNRKSTYSNKES